jgi:hypothetical protein
MPLTTYQRRVIIISVFLLSSNIRANALPALIAVYLHSTNTPDRVIEVLAHMGLSISLQTTRRAIQSLSDAAIERIKKVGQSLEASPGYDNINITFNVAEPTATSQSQFRNMTTATLVRLHKVAPDDLRVAKLLWDTNPQNPKNHSMKLVPLDWSSLSPTTQGLSNAQRVRKTHWWHITRILLAHLQETHPKAVKKYLRVLDTTPGEVNLLELHKTEQIPMRAMDLDEGTAEGNAQISVELLRQTGLAETDLMEEFVWLLHGDLATLERIDSLKGSRSNEFTNTPARLQHMIGIPGLFHAKMAAVDCIWRIYIQPEPARTLNDATLWTYTAILRERELGKMGSKPGFRRVHDTIQHTLEAFVVAFWLRKVSSTSLESWIEQEPTWEEIKTIANEIVTEYVHDIGMAAEAPDKAFQNQRLMFRDFLLYTEFSHAMNSGDIGRVEDILPLWIFLWKATGKHKYASYYHRIMLNLRTWPPSLAAAFRNNWLCNPTGKPFGWRGIDWMIELNNLYIQRIFGGVGSNRCVTLIQKNSVLIELLRLCHNLFDHNFHNTSRTRKHSRPAMREKIEELVEKLLEVKALDCVEGRRVKHQYIDALSEGMSIYQFQLEDGAEEEDGANEDDGTEKVVIELGDLTRI